MKIKTNFYTITAYRNLMYLESFSSWDEVVMQQAIEDMKNIAQTYYVGTQWAVLNNSENWNLHTPDAENLGKNTVRTEMRAGLTHNAVVVGKSAIKEWQTNNIFKDAPHFESRIFQTMEEATSWLESLGYTMTPLILSTV